MEEAFEGMTLTPPPAPLLHRPPEPPTVTSPQYFGGDGVSWMGGLPREWGSLKEEMYIPTSFGLVHGQHCSLCGAVIDLKLHSTLCSIRCCTGKCVCLDSLVAKALLELPPAPVHSPVLRLPVWVVQSFLETWSSEPVTQIGFNIVTLLIKPSPHGFAASTHFCLSARNFLFKKPSW